MAEDSVGLYGACEGGADYDAVIASLTALFKQ
jgi:hypothetical protein